MRLWAALFVPPVAFLTVLSAAYALVPWACETQRHLSLHVVALVCLAITAGGMALAWRDWKEAGLEEPVDKSEHVVQARFIAVMSFMLSAVMSYSKFS